VAALSHSFGAAGWDILALPLSWSWAWCCTSHRGDDALLTSSHRDPALKLKLKTITINIDRHAKRYHIISILLTMKVIAAALLTLLSTYTVTGKSDGKSKSGVECNQETIRRLWQCKHLLLLSLSSYHSSSHSDLINVFFFSPDTTHDSGTPWNAYIGCTSSGVPAGTIR